MGGRRIFLHRGMTELRGRMGEGGPGDGNPGQAQGAAEGKSSAEALGVTGSGTQVAKPL